MSAVDMRYIAALARHAHALDYAPPCPECDGPMDGDGDRYICPAGCGDIREGELCNACGAPFAADEWDDRHTDSYGADVHAECCDVCEGDE